MADLKSQFEQAVADSKQLPEKPDNMTLLLAGKAVGGTTVINSGTSLRPLRECLEGWDQVAGTSFAG